MENTDAYTNRMRYADEPIQLSHTFPSLAPGEVVSFLSANFLRAGDIGDILGALSSSSWVQPTDLISGTAVTFTVAVKMSYSVTSVVFSIYGTVTDATVGSWVEVGTVDGSTATFSIPTDASSCAWQYFSINVDRCVHSYFHTSIDVLIPFVLSVNNIPHSQPPPYWTFTPSHSNETSTIFVDGPVRLNAIMYVDPTSSPGGVSQLTADGAGRIANGGTQLCFTFSDEGGTYAFHNDETYTLEMYNCNNAADLVYEIAYYKEATVNGIVSSTFISSSVVVRNEVDQDVVPLTMSFVTASGLYDIGTQITIKAVVYSLPEAQWGTNDDESVWTMTTMTTFTGVVAESFVPSGQSINTHFSVCHITLC